MPCLGLESAACRKCMELLRGGKQLSMEVLATMVGSIDEPTSMRFCAFVPTELHGTIPFFPCSALRSVSVCISNCTSRGQCIFVAEFLSLFGTPYLRTWWCQGGACTAPFNEVMHRTYQASCKRECVGQIRLQWFS